MEGGTGSGSGGGGSGGPAPFLLKTYEMLEDPSTDNIVSWSSTNDSFIVWNPAEFGRLLLPSYFKHNNFSSFIRQLNTYGFRKIHPERWEFANDDFVKDQKHLLKNIHRRKPVHSHSLPLGSSHVDPERSAFEKEMEKLLRDKTTIESNISIYKQHNSAAELHLQDLRRRLDGMEKRQENLQSFFQKALQNPKLVEQICHKIESMDLSTYNKKRRLPQVDDDLQLVESQNNYRTEFGNVFHQDFSDKLKLDMNSPTTQSSNECEEGEPKGMQATTTLAFEPESSEEGDKHISCHLDLSLASATLQVNKNSYSAASPQIDCQEIGKLAESTIYVNDKECDSGASSNKNLEASNNPVTPVAPIRVNDLFWEQFLTERPGQEAISSYRAKTSDEQDEGKLVGGISKYLKNMDQLTL